MASTRRVPMRRVQLLAPTSITGVASGSGVYTGTVKIEDFNFSTAFIRFQLSSASGTTAIEPIIQQFVDGSWVDMGRGGSMTTNTTKNIILRAPCDDKYVGVCGSATLSASTIGTCPVSSLWKALITITSGTNTSGVVSCNAYLI